MTTLKGQEELDQYKLTKREVADFLGISTNAVRMSMRGNNCHNWSIALMALSIYLKYLNETRCLVG